jgi:hypothetical protein
MPSNESIIGFASRVRFWAANLYGRLSLKVSLKLAHPPVVASRFGILSVEPTQPVFLESCSRVFFEVRICGAFELSHPRSFPVLTGAAFRLARWLCWIFHGWITRG